MSAIRTTLTLGIVLAVLACVCGILCAISPSVILATSALVFAALTAVCLGALLIEAIWLDF